MKKSIHILLLLIGVVCLFASCSSEDDGVDSLNKADNKQKSIAMTIRPDYNPDQFVTYQFPDGHSGAGYYPGFWEVGRVNNHQLLLATWTAQGYLIHNRTYLKFDFSRLRRTDRIKSAKLTLYSHPKPTEGHHGNGYANNGSNNGFYIRQITSTVVAPVPQTTTANQAYVPHTSSPFLNLYSIDVTAMVKDMVNNDRNLGFLLRLANESTYTSRSFCGCAYATEYMRPSIDTVIE